MLYKMRATDSLDQSAIYTYVHAFPFSLQSHLDGVFFPRSNVRSLIDFLFVIDT